MKLALENLFSNTRPELYDVELLGSETEPVQSLVPRSLPAPLLAAGFIVFS